MLNSRLGESGCEYLSMFDKEKSTFLWNTIYDIQVFQAANEHGLSHNHPHTHLTTIPLVLHYYVNVRLLSVVINAIIWCHRGMHTIQFCVWSTYLQFSFHKIPKIRVRHLRMFVAPSIFTVSHHQVIFPFFASVSWIVFCHSIRFCLKLYSAICGKLLSQNNILLQTNQIEILFRHWLIVSIYVPFPG